MSHAFVLCALGVLCVGGYDRRAMARQRRIRPELQPRVLVTAYAAGAFPMPDPDEPECIEWFSPERRGLLPLDGRLHVPRRLARTIRQGRFLCTRDRAFDQVMRGCGRREEGTWITDDFLAAYGRLHELGLAHSVEAWEQRVAGVLRSTGILPVSSTGVSPVPPTDAGETPATPLAWAPEGVAFEPGQLAGGVYGVAIGGAFFAESMFHTITDAGKVALAHLVAHLRQQGFALCDTQWLTPHLAAFGGFEIERPEYLAMLTEALARRRRF